jgi:hypothetical protein
MWKPRVGFRVSGRTGSVTLPAWGRGWGRRGDSQAQSICPASAGPKRVQPWARPAPRHPPEKTGGRSKRGRSRKPCWMNRPAPSRRPKMRSAAQLRPCTRGVGRSRSRASRASKRRWMRAHAANLVRIGNGLSRPCRSGARVSDPRTPRGIAMGRGSRLRRRCRPWRRALWPLTKSKPPGRPRAIGPRGEGLGQAASLRRASPGHRRMTSTESRALRPTALATSPSRFGILRESCGAIVRFNRTSSQPPVPERAGRGKASMTSKSAHAEES